MSNSVIYPTGSDRYVGRTIEVNGITKVWDGEKWLNKSKGNHESRLVNEELLTVANLKAEGFSGKYGFFNKGFTYTGLKDLGVDDEGNLWKYIGSDPLPKEVLAGTDPSSELSNYELATYSNSETDIPTYPYKIGYISYYLDQGLTFEEALYAACLEHTIVSFEGLNFSTDELINIPVESKCRIWHLEGASLTFNYGQLIFNNRMSEIDLGGGSIDLGLHLAKVAETGTKDAITIKVDENHNFVVGDYVTSSLDIDYLPNSSDRKGFLENGDYNRITSIDNNGDGTETFTLTYSFLPSSNASVYSGLIENAWLGNASFLLTGLDFRGNPDGFLKIHNGKVINPRGYYFTLFNGSGDARKATVELDVIVENSFIDMVRFRGHGITFGGNYYAMRQYDLAKQHLVCSIPENGFIKYVSGCRCERLNGDAEVFCTPFESGDTLAECGVILVEKGVIFDGTKPDDLPESDFSQGGQIYFGYNVPIHDCYHFVQPNAPHVKMGGITFSGEVKGFQRSIYGTTFSSKLTFNTGPMNFYGAKLSCEPVFISSADNINAQTRMSKYPVSLDGCYIESRGLPNFDGGAYIYAKQCYIKLPVENRDTPQMLGSQGFNFITMEGGYLDGRYAIAGSDTILKNVHIPYSDDAANVPIFQNGNLANPNDTHLILDPPLDDLYKGTTSFIDVYENLNLTKWFGSNYSTRTPAPPYLRFKFNNYPQILVYGGVGGYSRQYQMQLISGRIDLPPLPTKGKWSSLVGQYDKVSVLATGQEKIINSAQHTTLASAASVGDSSVSLTDTPLGSPDVIGIYQSTFGEYIYYNVISTSGNSVELGESYTANTGILPNIGNPVGSEVVLINYLLNSTDISEEYGVFLDRLSNLNVTSGDAVNIAFTNVVYDDSNGEYFNLSDPTKIYVPSGVSRVDIAASVELDSSGVLADSQHHIRLIQYNSLGNRVRIAASTGGYIGYTDYKNSVSSQGIPVSDGDYFEVSFRHNNRVTVAIQDTYVSIRKSS